jgi:predicted permease
VTGFVEEKHWAGMERITYMVFFPASSLKPSSADLSSVPVVSVGGALMGAICSWRGSARPAPDSGAASRSRRAELHLAFPGRHAWKHFVAIAVAGSLFGQRGVALMAVAIAAMVPLLNVLALYVFVRYAGGPRQSARQVLRTFVTNPFIWSSALGLLLNPIGPYLPRRSSAMSTSSGGPRCRPGFSWSAPASICGASPGRGRPISSRSP